MLEALGITSLATQQALACCVIMLVINTLCYGLVYGFWQPTHGLWCAKNDAYVRYLALLIPLLSGVLVVLLSYIAPGPIWLVLIAGVNTLFSWMIFTSFNDRLGSGGLLAFGTHDFRCGRGPERFREHYEHELVALPALAQLRAEERAALEREEWLLLQSVEQGSPVDSVS